MSRQQFLGKLPFDFLCCFPLEQLSFKYFMKSFLIPMLLSRVSNVQTTISVLTHSYSRVPLENIVCYFHTFVNNLGIKQKFTKYLKESCS